MLPNWAMVLTKGKNMFNRDGQPNPSEYRIKTLRRGPGRPTRLEKARHPRQALARLLVYLKPYKAGMQAVLMFVIASTAFGLVGPYLMGLAIDKFITTPNPAGLGQIALWMLIAFLAGNACDAISSWIMAGISQSALKNIRRDLFDHLQTLPLAFFDACLAGELMSRLTNDIEAINQAVSQNVVALFANTLSLGGILTAMFVLNFRLAFVSLIVLPLLFCATEFIARRTRRGYRDLQKHLGELNAVMEETISGQRVVKAFRRNEAAIEAFRKSNQDVYLSGIRANSYAHLMAPLTNQLGNLFVIVLAGLGGWLALMNLATVGVIATFISYGRNFISPLRQLANIYNTIQAALAGAERVFEIIDSPAEIDDGLETIKLEELRGEVRFENVNFSYTSGQPVIKDMNLEAKQGETIALVGPTGAGKTTIVNLLTRFYEINSGQIKVDGTDIRQIKKDDLRRWLGIVLQDTFLFSVSVMDNIRYGRLDATDEEVIEAARMADADHFIRQLPNGYQTILSERASNLSQGQRQMLAIARAILADPGILILDEATSSVDTRTEARIQNALLRLMEGRTSFVIAHRLSTIREADQLLVIKDGEIVERGTHELLLEQRGFYHFMYMSQFKGAI
jgi:ATP-binding cassette subfamily B multidrug efflux pump